MEKKRPAFVSYARKDSTFAQRLAADLKANGANVWLDQLDIRPGRQWDREVEQALTTCNTMLVILSPAAIESNNVMDEVAFALEERKTVIPVLLAECRIPFRLRRVQYIDFKVNYELGLLALLGALAQEDQVTSDLMTTTLPAALTGVPGLAEAFDKEVKAEKEDLQTGEPELAESVGNFEPEPPESEAMRAADRRRLQIIVGLTATFAGFMMLYAVLAWR